MDSLDLTMYGGVMEVIFFYLTFFFFFYICEVGSLFLILVILAFIL